LAVIREELAAQIRLLELELKKAETAADPAVEPLERVKKLHSEAKTITDSEMAEVQRDADMAKLDVERARTALELYRKVDPREPAQPVPAEETPRTESPGAKAPRPAESPPAASPRAKPLPPPASREPH
jgi:hypothetical protein